MKTKLAMVAGGALLLGVLALGLVPTYRIEPVERPQVLCSQTECLLMVSVEYNRWVSNMLRDAGKALRSYFGISNPPTQKIMRTVLFTIHSDTTSRLELGDVINRWGVFDNAVYIGGDSLRKWKSSRLEDLSSEERDRYRDADRRGNVLTGDFTDKNGWSAKSYLAPGTQFDAVLNGRPVKISRKKIASETLTIEVERGEETRETIWQMDDSFRRLPQSEYSRIFQQSSR